MHASNEKGADQFKNMSFESTSFEAWTRKSQSNVIRRNSMSGKKSGRWSSGVMSSKHLPHTTKLKPTTFPPKRLIQKQTLVDIDIPGVKKIFDSSYSTKCRVVWSIAILLSLIGFTYELVDRLVLYFKYPISVDVQVQRNDTIRFPSVTLCPGMLPFEIRQTLERRVRAKMVGMTRGGSIWYNDWIYKKRFEAINLTLNEIWEEFSISDDDVTVTTPCATSADYNTTECNANGLTEVSMKRIPMKTYWGTCLVLFTETCVAYRGPDTYVKLKITGNGVKLAMQAKTVLPPTATDEDGLGRRSLHFFVHKEGVFRRHEAFVLSEPILKGYFTVVRFSIKEFHLLNTTENPCTNDEVDPIRCVNRCVDRLLESNLNCSLPFIHSTRLSPCSTIEDTLFAYHAAESVYRMINNKMCPCPRNCYEKVFSLSPDVWFPLPGGPHHTTMTLYYPDNVNEIVKEMYSYRFPGLFSDVSAYLSFFFGFSALSFLELAEAVAQRRQGQPTIDNSIFNYKQ